MPEDRSLEFKHDEDFASMYANNVQFESTVWDLKMTFGRVNLAESSIEQHTSMALAWPQAKLAAYFMVANVILHQAQNGQVFIPPSVLPQRPDPFDPAIEESGRKVVEYLAWVYEQFFGENQFNPPSSWKDDRDSEASKVD